MFALILEKCLEDGFPDDYVKARLNSIDWDVLYTSK
jgi:hypothetical protein